MTTNPDAPVSVTFRVGAVVEYRELHPDRTEQMASGVVWSAAPAIPGVGAAWWVRPFVPGPQNAT